MVVDARRIDPLLTTEVPSTAWSGAGDRLGPTSCEPLALTGSPSVPLPPTFLEGIDISVASTRLPARGHPTLRDAIAVRMTAETGIAFDPRSEVLVTNGAMHALDCVFRALVPDGGTVGMVCPTFFADRLLAGRANIVRFDTRNEDGWHLTDELIDRVRSSQLDMLFLVNPNNPTGVVFEEGELRALLEATDGSNTLVVVDEAYEAFVYDGRRHVSLSGLAHASRRVVTVRSFTKSYGLVAARVGWVVGPAELLDPVARVLEWVTLASNPLSQVLALAALDSADLWRPRLVDQFAANREALVGAIGSGLLPPTTPIPEGATFAALDVTALDVGSEEAARSLWQATGIACVPGIEFPGDPSVTDGFVRLPIGATEAVFAEALERLGRYFR
jgi:aspartate/methionine/tyrosine aminotransferase